MIAEPVVSGNEDTIGFDKDRFQHLKNMFTTCMIPPIKGASLKGVDAVKKTLHCVCICGLCDSDQIYF